MAMSNEPIGAPGGGPPQQPSFTPTGTPYYWYLTGGTPSGDYNNAGGYYGTGGGMGYIQATGDLPWQADMAAWDIYTEMRRNGWNPNSPFGIDEARRGMGQFSKEQMKRFWEEYLRNMVTQTTTKNKAIAQVPPGLTEEEFIQWINDHAGQDFNVDLGTVDQYDIPDHVPVEGWEKAIYKMFGNLKGFKNIARSAQNAAENATFKEWWDDTLNDTQRDWVEQWMVGQGADKNWKDRLNQGDAPWSNSDTAINQTARQNPDAPTGVEHREPRVPENRQPRGGGGGGEEGESNWTPPPYQALYNQGQQFQPYFLAWQPTSTSGPVKFVK